MALKNGKLADMASAEKEVSGKAATSLVEAANAHNSLEGYAAINGLDQHDETARLAYEFYEARNGHGGSADEDWLRAEQQIRRREHA